MIHSGFLDGAEPLIRDLGGDPSAMARLCGLPTDALLSDGLTLPGGRVFQFLDAAASQFGRDFALRMAARRGGLHMLGPLWVVMRNAETIGESLSLGADNLAIRMTAVTAKVGRDQDMHVLEVDTNAAPACDVQAVEFCVALVVLQVQAWLGSGWRPVTTQFRHAPPETRATHAALFGHSVQFDQDRNAITFDQATWTQPLPGRDKRIGPTWGAFIAEERSFATAEVALRVTQHLKAKLREGRISLAEVASDLGCSPRSLQRQLQGEGAIFQDLLGAVRLELADRYLRHSGLTISQIGDVLQFSGVAAFSRFVKSQTGRSPTEIRHAHRALRPTSFLGRSEQHLVLRRDHRRAP